MTALWHILRLMLRDQRPAMLRGAALTLMVLLMGVALLGLSGWFITAAAGAGLLGLGTVFDVFRPSAGVRFLALGRAAARYGERVLTHDATLRALESLRRRLLAGYLAAPWDRIIRIRGAQALNRLTADVEALDGLPLRLTLPVGAAVAALAVAGAMLWWLTAPLIALWLLIGWALAGGLVLWRGARAAVPLSRRAEQAAQAFRSRMIDLIRGRADLAVYGQLGAQAAAIQAAEDRRLALRRALDRVERRAGLALGAAQAVLAGGALALGMWLAGRGTISPAQAALGFFAALALTEAAAPLRRAVADLGRMADAARRVKGGLATPVASAGTRGTGEGLSVAGLTVARPGSDRPLIAGLTFAVGPGETLALTGPSGCGKSTVLLALAGLHPFHGAITVAGLTLSGWSETGLRQTLALVPQRSALMAGTVDQALRLARPDATDAELWAVLQATALAPVIAARGGLTLRLGPRGEGLSGGEGRRLALARALLRRPDILLLDEATEGLDEATAAAVLAGIRAHLPHAAIVMAAHRPVETAFADRRIALQIGVGDVTY